MTKGASVRIKEGATMANNDLNAGINGIRGRINGCVGCTRPGTVPNGTDDRSLAAT
jgi:hypothetical protein